LTVLITDLGFVTDDWEFGFHSLDTLPEIIPVPFALDIQNSFSPEILSPMFADIDLIRINFPSFSDGRGFSLARQIRLLGYVGRLRAFGPLLADQYTMLRRAGFDEVEVPREIAQRQPEPDWLARSNWQINDYQTRLRQFDGL